jgi:hypothetical protein
MKTILFLGLFLSQAAFAENEFAWWKWGVGFGQQSLMKATTHFEVGSPALVQKANYLHSAILSLDTARTNRGVYGVNGYNVFTSKLMWEFRHGLHKELFSYYFRLGAGYSSFNKAIDSSGGVFIVPFQIGLDVVIQENERGVSTFFTQVGYDFNFKDEKKPVSDLAGTQIVIGLRRAY